MDAQEKEQIAFQIISSAGTASSLLYKALQESKEGRDYSSIIEEANEELTKAHRIHLQLISESAEDVSLLLVHAEDYLMNTELQKHMILEMIEERKELQKIKEALLQNR